MKYYWLIITILFIVKVLKGKELSSYNIKWMFLYVIYLLWLQAEFFNHVEWEDVVEDYIIWAFLVPIFTYLLFPFIWKYIGKVGLFRWMENIIDKWYNTIKNS